MSLTKYKDFVGKASMDADTTNTGNRINKIMEAQGVDLNRYEGIGLSIDFYSGEYSYCPICIDKLQGTDENPKIVKLHLPDKLTTENFHYLADTFGTYVIDKYHLSKNIEDDVVGLQEVFIEK